MPRHALMAAVIGLAATLLALGVAALGGAGATALEWSVYDRGVRARAAAPVSPALLVVARDPASEARFGTGSWDRRSSPDSSRVFPAPAPPPSVSMSRSGSRARQVAVARRATRC